MIAFSKKEFWDTRYSTAPVATYDWYIQWAQMKKLVLAHVDPLKTSSNRMQKSTHKSYGKCDIIHVMGTFHCL